MSPDPIRRIKKATKPSTEAAAEAASKGARTVGPRRLTKGVGKRLPLSLRTRVRLLVARLWAKLKMWRLRRRARNV